MRSATAAILNTCHVPEAVRQRIFDCQTEDNWDDEGATGITWKSCNAALEFLQEVLERDNSIPIPSISPSVYGQVTLHWRNGGKHLIARPSADTDLTFYRFSEAEGVSSYGDASRNQVMQRVLNFFSAGHAE